MSAVLSVARVATGSGSRYLQQLAKHWSHKMPVAFTAEETTIDFASGARLVMRADADGLEVELSTAAEDAERMRGVVAEHLDRFAFREAPLAFDWRFA